MIRRRFSCALSYATPLVLAVLAASPDVAAVDSRQPNQATVQRKVTAPANAASPMKFAPQKNVAANKKKPAARSLPEPSLSGPILQRFLDGPMANVERIVFATRVSMHDHWYVNFGYYSNEPDRRGYGDGGRLCLLNLRTGKLEVLLDDPKGGVRDPQVHYDGQKILFSYRRGNTPTYHLYEINADGSGMKQLTDGPDDDIEPTYCPDGSIVFGSSRCRRFVNCWFSRVTTLYRCDGDGKNIRMLSSNNDHDNTAWMTADGRILYMRWEYVDRSQVHYHHLWTMNPDGTSQMVYFGNEIGGIAMLDAKSIPGTNKVVSSFSPGHGIPEHIGHVTVVDPSRGPDVPSAARNISKRAEWRDPYAFSEDCFLVANKVGLWVMDGEGTPELIYQLPEADRFMECHEPRPLVARPREPIIPARVDLSKATGRLVLQDVYAGRNMSGIQRGEIRKLLVLQQVPKPVNFSGGMEPLTIGGSFTLAQILGTVPVEPDGSAYIETPALRSLFFIALDEKGDSVKRMHSFVTLQPGETMSCVGCHEQRNTTPHFKPDLAALERKPSPITPIAAVPDVIDFPRDIQPILNKHCVSCHNPDRYDGKLDLCGDKTAMYTISYWAMRTHDLVADGRNLPVGSRPPRSVGAPASRLMQYLGDHHYHVKLSDAERLLIRLWIETGATYPGTYASLGCGHYPVGLPYGRLLQQCRSCHGREVNDRHGKRTVLFFGPSSHERPEPTCNLSRPEKSLILKAPLAKEAGGLGLCKKAVWANQRDPVYQAVLASIQNAHDRLVQGKRFDMPGFRPNEHYIREMQRFGFLPKNLKPTDPIDVYAVDRAYWASFHYQPLKDAVAPDHGP